MSKKDEGESAEDINGGFFRGKMLDGVSRICCSHYQMINGAVLRRSGLRSGKKSPSKEKSLTLCLYQGWFREITFFVKISERECRISGSIPTKCVRFWRPVKQ